MRGERFQRSPERYERTRRYSPDGHARARRYSPEHRHRRRETVDEFGRSVQRSVDDESDDERYYHAYHDRDRPTRKQRRSVSPRDRAPEIERRDVDRDGWRDDVSLSFFLGHDWQANRILMMDMTLKSDTRMMWQHRLGIAKWWVSLLR